MNRIKICLTFDDGAQEDLAVGRLLDRYGIKATWFIPVNTTELKWSKLMVLYIEGHEIGTHGLTHSIMSSTHMGTKEIHYQLSHSKSQFEEYGIPIYGFAYPYGRYDQSTVNCVKAAGYEYARTITNMPYDSTRPYEIPAHFCLDNLPDRNYRERLRLVKDNLITWGHAKNINLLDLELFIQAGLLIEAEFLTLHDFLATKR